MRKIKITYDQLMEAIGAKDETPFDDDADNRNLGSKVFANHPSVDTEINYKPTTSKDIAITPQMTGDIGRIKRH